MILFRKLILIVMLSFAFAVPPAYGQDLCGPENMAITNECCYFRIVLGNGFEWDWCKKSDHPDGKIITRTIWLLWKVGTIDD